MVKRVDKFGDMLAKKLSLGPSERAHIKINLPKIGETDVYVRCFGFQKSGLKVGAGFNVTIKKWRGKGQFVAEEDPVEAKVTLGLFVPSDSAYNGARMIIGGKLNGLWGRIEGMILEQIDKKKYKIKRFSE